MALEVFWARGSGSRVSKGETETSDDLAMARIEALPGYDRTYPLRARQS